MITIMRKFTDGWCEGELNGKKGMFPSNYVTDLVPPEEDEEEASPCVPIAFFPMKLARVCAPPIGPAATPSLCSPSLQSACALSIPFRPDAPLQAFISAHDSLTYFLQAHAP